MKTTSNAFSNYVYPIPTETIFTIHHCHHIIGSLPHLFILYDLLIAKLDASQHSSTLIIMGENFVGEGEVLSSTLLVIIMCLHLLRKQSTSPFITDIAIERLNLSFICLYYHCFSFHRKCPLFLWL